MATAISNRNPAKSEEEEVEKKTKKPKKPKKQAIRDQSPRRRSRRESSSESLPEELAHLADEDEATRKMLLEAYKAENRGARVGRKVKAAPKAKKSPKKKQREDGAEKKKT